MSFGIKTDKFEWDVSIGQVIGTEKSVFIAFNEDLHHIVADSLDHLYIAIDQFEHPEECQ